MTFVLNINMGAGRNKTSKANMRSNPKEPRRHLKPILPKLPKLESAPQISQSLQTCYICDERTNGLGTLLMNSSSDLPTKIGQLMGDGFLVVVTHEDIACRRCCALLNHVDQLEADLKRIKSQLKNHLLRKYNYADSSLNLATESVNNPKVLHLVETDDESNTYDSSKSLKPKNNQYRAIKPKPVADNDKPSFQCTMCEQQFDSQRTMRIHKMKVHLSTWTCHFCNAIFEDENEYSIHISSHLGDTTPLLHDCSECGQTFQNKQSLSEHMDTHLDLQEDATSHIKEENVAYSCNICSLDFLQEDAYDEHMQSHEDLNVLDLGNLEKADGLPLDVFEPDSEPVDILDKMFDSADAGENSFMCAECKIEYQSLEEMNEHLQLNHAKNEMQSIQISQNIKSLANNILKNRFICNCGALAEDATALTLHKKECQSENNLSDLVCQFCGAVASNREEFVLHCDLCSKVQSLVGEGVMVVNNDEIEDTAALNNEANSFGVKKQRVFTCFGCQETFPNKAAFQMHGVENPKHLQLQCPDCSKKFQKEKALNEHRDEMHPEAHCRFCAKVFLNLKQLKAHEARHIRAVKCKFVCTECPRIFQTATGLKQHEATHTGVYKYSCEFCGKGFVSRMRAEEHRASHTKEERYSCEICGAKFSHQATYWIHRKWHKDPRPYKCEHCGRLFKHSSLLAVHKRKHTGERPYVCTYCDQSFTVGNTLKRHISLHTGIFAYTCSVCRQGFSAKHKMAAHMSKVHQDDSLLQDQQNKKNQGYKMIIKDPVPEEEEVADMDFDETWILSGDRTEGQYLTLKTDTGEQILLAEGMLDEQGDNQLVEIVLQGGEDGRLEYSEGEVNLHPVDNMMESETV